MKLTTLVKLARGIEGVLHVSTPHRVTCNEMHALLKLAAGPCRTKREAVELIAEIVYSHPLNGDYPATDEAIRSLAQ